jgi:photosystem II stability/assembly factor-like uncharacterized protein
MRRFGHQRIILLVLLWIGGLDIAQAGINEWTTNGPQRGAVNAIAIDPKLPSTLYAGTSNGIFKTTDGGTTWKQLSMGQTNGAVASFAIDPATPNVVYAGTSLGALKTTNG